MSDYLTKTDPLVWFGCEPSHEMTEAQYLRYRAEAFERLYSGNVDDDPAMAEEYYATAKILQARADELDWMAEAEADMADFVDLKQTEEYART